MKKIAYISGTRADFGLMVPVLKSIEKSQKLELQLYMTGVHLMPEFGRTSDLVKKQFPKVSAIGAIFPTDDRLGMAIFMGEYINKLVKILNKNKPDLVLVLGDRVEMLCTAIACVYLGIPTAHLHGGEKTSTLDEISRQAITKLSTLHFAATKKSAERIRKMGEEPWRIYIVGAPALDTILNEKLPSKEKVFKKLGLNLDKKIILVSQHPVTEQINNAGKQMEETLAAVRFFNIPTVVVYPHPDPGGRKIIKVIERMKGDKLIFIFPSLEHKDFLVLEREAAVIVGNSSAAMIESSSFHTPVVNIGDRQKGRERGDNVIDVDYNREQIKKAIEKSLNDKDYLKKISKIKNPWGDGRAAERVRKILEEVKLENILNKQITY